MILIGDAGNHDEVKDAMGRTLEQAVNTMSDYDMNMVSFQVKYNTQYEAYIKFNDDAMEYLFALSNSAKIDNNTRTQLSKSNEYENTYNISFKSADGTDISGLYTFGSFTYAPDRTQMDGSVLESNIRNTTHAYLSRINERIQILRRKLDGEVIYEDNVTTDAYDEEVTKVLCSYCKDDNEKYKECLRFLSSIGDFSYVGYTNINMYDEDPVYNPVVFLSRTEFNKIQKSFQDMQDLGSYSQMKENLYKALVAQAEVITGDPGSIIEEKTLNEIWEILLNIPFDYYNSYGDLKYKKLKDIKSLNSSDFKRFLSDFIDKAADFSPNKYQNRQFSLGSDDLFYWIPLKDFPGNE
jgi:hypothetical protein